MDHPEERAESGADGVGRPADLRLSVLGRVEATRDGVPISGLSRRRKPLAVLAYMALASPSGFLERDHLCGIFWPDSTQDRARASLRQALSVIRTFLPDVLEQRGDEEVRLRAGALSVDLEELRAAVRREAWSEVAELARDEPFRGFHIPRANAIEDWISSLQLEVRSIQRTLAAKRPLPDVPEDGDARRGSRQPSTQPPARGTRQSHRGVHRTAALASLVLVAVAVVLVARTRGAVLPDAVAVSTPEFLGADEDGVHVARGLQEELVASLSSVSGLSVVPVGAVRRAERSYEIGADLARAVNARYELDTSIQLENRTYRVTLTFVDWASESVVWSESYQAPERGMLDLRVDTRSMVSDALSLEIDDLEQRHAGATSEAMPHYLIAIGLMGIEGTGPDRTLRWDRATAQLDTATLEAPEFAAAWAHSALLGYRKFWLGADPSRDGIVLADAALARARELQPDGREYQLARAYRTYHVDRDWATASRLAAGFVRRFGANPDAILLWAMSERRQGHFDAAIDILAGRLSTHPLEYPSHWVDLFHTYRRTGRLAEADELLELVEAVEGHLQCSVRYERTYHQARSMNSVDRVVDECRMEQEAGLYASLRFWHQFRMRRFDQALSVIDTIVEEQRLRGVERPDWINQQWAPFPVDLWRGLIYRYQGEIERARATYNRHIPELERLVAEFPDLALRRRLLAVAYSGAGNWTRALEEAQTALELALDDGDLWAGIPASYQQLMFVYAESGDPDAAIDILDNKLTSGTAPFIGLNQLLLDPRFDVLRHRKGFEDVVARVEASQPL